MRRRSTIMLLAILGPLLVQFSFLELYFASSSALERLPPAPAVIGIIWMLLLPMSVVVNVVAGYRLLRTQCEDKQRNIALVFGLAMFPTLAYMTYWMFVHKVPIEL